MSYKLLGHVWDLDLPDHATKLVLLRLADSANDETGECWPSLKHIQDKCNIKSKNTIRRALEVLEQLGLLVVIKRKLSAKQNTSNLYRLNIKKILEPSSVSIKLGGGSNSELGGSNSELGGGSNSEPRTNNSFEPINELNSPIIPQGESASANDVPVAENKKQRSLNIDYVGIGKAYNQCVAETGKNLPSLADPENLSQARKRKIKILAAVMKKRFGSCDAETFKNYFLDFMKSARSFYFGENERGWRADFEYILSEKIMDKTIEGSL
ncbi:TPA: helix-turn-helix domain-containing protein [Pasteurella multocida]